jgi:hypothetical protein
VHGPWRRVSGISAEGADARCRLLALIEPARKRNEVIVNQPLVRMGNRTYEGVMALVIGNRKVLLSAPYKFRRQDLA